MVQIIVELVVIALLGATIYYAVMLNRRLGALRAQETALVELMAKFTEASVRAEAAIVQLRNTGVETEKALRPAIEKGQALCDELAFMLEAGGTLADQLDRARAALKSGIGGPVPEAAPAKQPLPHPGEAVVGRSAAERELLRVMKGGR